jgi:hypothetical protein
LKKFCVIAAFITFIIRVLVRHAYIWRIHLDRFNFLKSKNNTQFTLYRLPTFLQEKKDDILPLQKQAIAEVHKQTEVSPSYGIQCRSKVVQRVGHEWH